MATQIINQLPAPTFSWLGVNGCERELPDGTPEAVAVKAAAGEAARLEIGRSTDLTVQGSGTVIAKIAADDAVLHTHIRAGYGEQIRFVQIFQNGSAISEVTADLDDTASLALIQIYLNPNDLVSGIRVHLNGRKSVFTSRIGYLLDGEHALDINLHVIQSGKKTASDTDVKGVLRGHAKKTFRGTIDFRNGCAGSVGAEREEVLLMDEAVQNQTVPVILCAEEDVSGTHGASIGQIDSKHIFYLQSRGIPEDRIYEMIALARLGSVIAEIGDAETESDIRRQLGTEDADA
jgi:Fe-S cluster assembly scaffold protein SufB